MPVQDTTTLKSWFLQQQKKRKVFPENYDTEMQKSNQLVKKLRTNGVNSVFKCIQCTQLCLTNNETVYM